MSQISKSRRKISRRLRLFAAAFLVFLVGTAPSRSPADVIRPLGESLVVANAGGDSIQGRPAIASDGTNFLVTWRDSSTGNVALARVTRDGAVLDVPPVVVGTGAYAPSVVHDGARYLLVWTASSEVWAVRVAGNGVPVDTSAVKITTGADVKDRPIGIAFDGTSHLLAWRTNSDQIRITRMTPSLQVLDNVAGTQIGMGFYPWVASGAGQFVVAWHAHGNGLDVVFSRIGADGLPIGGSSLNLPGDQDHVSVAFGGANYLVAWHDWRNTDVWGNGEAYAVRLGLDGTVLDNPAIKLTDTALWQVPVVATFDGSDYVVVWHANHPAKFRGTDTYGRRVSVTGSLPEEKPFPVATGYWHQGAPRMGASGDRLLVAWSDGRTGNACSGSCVGAQVLQRLTGSEPGGTISAPGTPTSGVWSSVSSPSVDHLNAVAAGGGGNVYAAGESGAIYRFENGSWQVSATAASQGRIYSVWADPMGPTTRALGWCWYDRSFDGSTWGPADCHGIGPPNDPYQIGLGIWGFGPQFAISVGTEGAYQRLRNGNRQMGLTGSSATLYGVWGTSPVNAYAVGEFGKIFRDDGVTWTPLTGIPTNQTLNAAWGTGPDDIFVVGDFGTILHFNGANWSVQSTPTTAHLYGISGSHSRDVYAVGLRGTILHYNGNEWRIEESGTTNSLLGVTHAGSTVWAVGEYGTLLSRGPGGGGAPPSLNVLLDLHPGFKLFGNSFTTGLDAVGLFGSADAPLAGISEHIVSVWAWNAATQRWRFHSPQLTMAQNSAYTSAKGFETLRMLQRGEGYWVNAISLISLLTQSGTDFNWSPSSFAALPSGFNLISHANTVTPSQFNVLVSQSPPSPGVVPTDNFLTLWAWDATQVKWYFHSPLLESTGGLLGVKAYADSKFFLHFPDFSKTLDAGVGFWVNRP